MSGPKILVISNPSDQAELVGALSAGDLGEPAAGDGGDDTFILYQSMSPDVVVLSAALDSGDARSLASAMRNGSQPVRIVLVGESRGPIRTALDAADFDVDRFVGRPLSEKALLFAVRQLADEAVAAREPEPAAELPVPQGIPKAPTNPAIIAAMNEAIEDFLEDAIDALDDVRPIESSPAEREADDAVEDVVAEPETVEDDVPSHVHEERAEDDSVTRERAVPQLAPEEETHKADVRHVAAASLDDVWDAPPPAPPLREPTLILSGGGAAPSPPPPPPVDEIDDEYTAPVPQLPWDSDPSVVTAGSLPSDADLDDIDDSPEDLSDLEDDLYEEITSAKVPAPQHTSHGIEAEPDEPPSGGAFARELRKKMSAMAERLFPGRSVDNLGIAHDAHTEIDLAALGVDTVSAYRDIGAADTFADTNPRADEGSSVSYADDDSEQLTASGKHLISVPQRGTLSDHDVARLFALVFRNEFTGRLEFSRPPAEKIVHIVDGRPVFASSNLPHDRMGDLLYREGKITREQHVRSREIVVESGRRMGEILVEMGFLKPRELLPAVRRHIEDIIYSLFSWTSGEFIASLGEATGERIRLSRHPAALVLEGVRRKYGRDLLDTRLGSDEAVIVVKAGEELEAILGVADLSPPEAKAIAAMDGESTVADAASTTGIDSLTASQLAYSLVALGVAEVVHRGGDAREVDAARSDALVGEVDLAIDRQRVLAKYALVDEADYFMLLGVRRDASAFEIKRAYEAARRDYSSDNFPVEVRRELSGEIDAINELIDEAYMILRDDDLRLSYLANLRE